MILHYHGGGWTIGNARMADDENAALATRLGVTVVAVDYRLALANPIRSVIAECASVMHWVVNNANGAFECDRIIVKGSSAGSQLALSALLKLRDEQHDLHAICGAALYYGLYDFSGTPQVRDAGPEVVILDGPTVLRTLKKLTPAMTDAERRAGWLSPLHTNLSSLLPALILVGEYDMLLEHNRRLAERWNAADGNAELLVAPSSPHAFDHFNTSVVRKVQDHADVWVKAAFAASTQKQPHLR